MITTVHARAIFALTFFSALLVGLKNQAQESINYDFKNVQIHGGGFVSGIIYHPTEQGLMYARTDVGGAYRMDFTDTTWIALNDNISREQSDFTGVLSLALDPNDADLIYMSCGLYTQSWAGNGALLKSNDRGESWTINALPFKVGGNEDGRSAGERMAVDPNKGDILFLGSNNDGLWTSTDAAGNWSKVNSFPQSSITFVLFDASSGSTGNATQTIYVGTNTTSNSIYKSTDGGQSWNAVANQPSGFLARQAVLTGDFLYAAYADALGPNGVTGGAVYKFNTSTGAASDISPTLTQGGFGGISADAQNEGTILVSSFDQWWPKDELFYSTDGGSSWTTLMMEPNYPFNDRATLDHSKTPYTDTHTPHWLGDVSIDPFNSDRAMFTTGYGIYATYNLTNSMATNWIFESVGIEETVPLELISPTQGAPLISCLGDIDGFKHDDLDATPGHRLNPEMGTNRGIAYAYKAPLIMARTHDQSNPTHGSYSTDGGDSWTLFGSEPSGISGGGSIAICADGIYMVWAPSGANVSYSNNNGASWTASTGIPQGLKVIADPVTAVNFYAFDGASGNFYRSTNQGKSFSIVSSGLPTVQSWELADATIVASPDQGGEIWLTAKSGGLYRSTNAGTSFDKVTSVGEAYKVTFGKAKTGNEHASVYIHGKVNGTLGFYRSDDLGETWMKINDDAHQFGWINDIEGDPKVFGRLYIATGGRGIVYAERMDCLGVPGGDAVEDACMACAGGTSGVDPNWSEEECFTTSVSDQADKVEIYPNPVQSVLHLNQFGKWTIFNAIGQQQMIGVGNAVDVQSLPTGTYWLEMQGERKLFSVR